MELKGGLVVNAEAVALALQLEADGHVLSVKDGKLIVSHGTTLSAEDRAEITKRRLHLIAIADYRCDEVSA